jgi:hypothetical protein
MYVAGPLVSCIQAMAFFAEGITTDSFGSDVWEEGEAGVDVLVTSAGIGRFGNIEELRCQHTKSSVSASASASP